MENKAPLRVAVVGVCAAGKSTLVAVLRDAGFDARHVAQEHSYVPYMWQRIGRPDVLIYLDVDYETVHKRRPQLHYRPADWIEQVRRLAHARQHCDLYLNTTQLAVAEVQARVLAFLSELEQKNSTFRARNSTSA
jgi:chloramphenicol 3-O-phosphotransferase